MTRVSRARVLVGVFAVIYLVVRFRYFADLSRHDRSELAPVGVASILRGPLPPAATWSIAGAAVALGVAFTIGARLRVTAPLFFAALLWVTTYRSSFGKILHSENLLVLHVGILALGAWIERRRRASGFTLRTMSIATVLTYFVAGASKLRAGGASWLDGRALGEWLAFDALRKIELGSIYSPVAVWLAGSPLLLAALSMYTLAVELGAPLALVSARASRTWVTLAWAFHAGILVTMAIGFFYPLSGVAFASMLGVHARRRT